LSILIKNGLIKGGSLENAVVIRDDAVLTTEPLRYPEEFVRHKMLDIVGDLSLLGRPIRGHLIAVKPSHAANCEMVRQISAQMNRPLRAAQAFAPPVPGPAGRRKSGGPIRNDKRRDGRDAGDEIMPHRYPFLMVDRIVKIDGNKITA
jgi:UDP-3-O-[3-hydroxymyristoyl] N-acetylglucosamine deacetylase / 3-hydroxyacyl-[acyl-carrier-protein] dehydratase